MLIRRDQRDSSRPNRRYQPDSSRQSPLPDLLRTPFPGRATALAEGIERAILKLRQEIEQLNTRVNKLERTVQIKQEEGQGEINKESHNRQNRPSSSQRHRSIVESTALERARCLILLQAAQRPNGADRTQRNEIRDEITDESGSPELARTQLQVAKGSPRFSRPRRKRLEARLQTSQGRQNWPEPNPGPSEHSTMSSRPNCLPRTSRATPMPDEDQSHQTRQKSSHRF